ncbi:3244_t:CDS:2 [Diversispora eburnea]|uniref:3244_t:CDS:1 n=1 Tax=Diversispora eburnea TaxID=1213867 RepID=A0A9N9CRN6_9GLOM|nr:3244_t:CDS:2 [Diversispora eburnea]
MKREKMARETIDERAARLASNRQIENHDSFVSKIRQHPFDIKNLIGFNEDAFKNF